MELDPLLLSRIQFAFVVSFHAIFPVFTIGLASFIAFLEILFFKTGNPVWERLSKFWVQVFAVVFGMGALSCLSSLVPTGAIIPTQRPTSSDPCSAMK